MAPTETDGAMLACKKARTEEDMVELRRERRVLDGLDHPNIIQSQPALSRDNLLMLEHGGVGMDKLCVAQGFAATGIARGLFIQLGDQLLRGLSYLHNRNIVHRDIKPENLLIDAGGRLRIGDFGLAKRLPRGCAFTSYVGTPLYMAPEIVQECPSYGKAVDIYAAGCTLYELLTGRRFLSREEGRGLQRPDFEQVRCRLEHALTASVLANFSQVERQALTALLAQMLHPDPAQRISVNRARRFMQDHLVESYI